MEIGTKIRINNTCITKSLRGKEGFVIDVGEDSVTVGVLGRKNAVTVFRNDVSPVLQEWLVVVTLKDEQTKECTLSAPVDPTDSLLEELTEAEGLCKIGRVVFNKFAIEYFEVFELDTSEESK